MNTSGFRACVKELYETRYDPLSVSYAVLTGQFLSFAVDKKGRNAEIVQLAVKYLQKNNLRRKA